MTDSIRILHVVSALDGGGVENILFNYYKCLDPDKVKFDFIIHEQKIGTIEKEFMKYDSRIWHVTSKKDNLWKNIKQIRQIIKEGNYKVIHCHQDHSSAIPLFFANISGVPVRIAHSHLTKQKKGIILRSIDYILSLIIKICATNYLACGNDAGIALYGSLWFKKGKKMVNAIDIDKFKFSEQTRQEYRLNLNLEDKFTLIHVGRFAEFKNHSFLIDVMSEYNQLNKKWCLLLAGDGELKDSIVELVQKKGLEKNIIFLGIRDDISEILNAVDILLLPSKVEGLPVSVIEAQASGLKILVSDNVTREVGITDSVEFIPLDIDKWLKAIIDSEESIRQDNINILTSSGYSIKKEAHNYYKWIKTLI